MYAIASSGIEWLAVPALVVVVLVLIGLHVLRGTSLSTWAKGVICGVLALAVIAVIGVSIGIQKGVSAVGSRVPECGYDVELDAQGRYRTPTILPFERRVFTDVVTEMRRYGHGPAAGSYDDEDLTDYSSRYSYVFEKVAERHDLDADTVEAIYLKVSSQLKAPRK